jgi:tetratricopeptide (TPR) repeat protein
MAAPAQSSNDWQLATPSGELQAETRGPAADLCRDMARRWAAGERPLAEEYLNTNPDPSDRSEAAIELLYEEICLRERFDEPIDADALLARFPDRRDQVRALLDCHHLIGSEEGGDRVPPAPGTTLAGCRVIALLGRGAAGRVYLATQPALADRPVVLKMSAPGAREHLSLARLQHTNIVPLYAVYDDPNYAAPILCMPYFGGAALNKVLDELTAVPPSLRDGKLIVAAIDRFHHEGLPGPARSPGRDLLARATYPQAIAWIGACLGQGLQYAHERGLVHLDIKPANVLLAADGQPMLLDFHLAQAPLPASAPAPSWLGGTPGYMAPEQEEAMECVRDRTKLTRPVDGRADIYALGALLYEALGGQPPFRHGTSPALSNVNRAVSPGLSDIVAKCLSPKAADRYADAASLVEDLRRHLTDRPLVGVRNRSIRENWVKWRRRNPHGLRTAALIVAAVASLAGAANLWRERAVHAQRLVGDQLASGMRQLNAGQLEAAVESLEHAERLCQETATPAETRAKLDDALRTARQALAVRELGRLTDRVRFLYPFDGPVSPALKQLATDCRELWQRREAIRDRLGVRAGERARVEDDIRDLAVLGARLLARAEGAPACEVALTMLDEAETLFGPSAALSRERMALGGPWRTAPPPRTAWEHYALGRALLADGDVDGAADQLAAAVDAGSDTMWPSFYHGQCAYRRGRYRDAVVSFSVCIGKDPTRAASFFNRALAFEAAGDTDAAMADYGRTVNLDPTLGVARLNRGRLYLRCKDYAAAIADLESALSNGAEPAATYFNLALAHGERGERKAAATNASLALQYNPRHAGARELLERLNAAPVTERR